MRGCRCGCCCRLTANACTHAGLSLRRLLPAPRASTAHVPQNPLYSLLVLGYTCPDCWPCLVPPPLHVLQSYAEVPLCLMLGLTTTASALLSLLPSEVIDRCMALRNFKLVGGWLGGVIRGVIRGAKLYAWLVSDVMAVGRRWRCCHATAACSQCWHGATIRVLPLRLIKWRPRITHACPPSPLFLAGHRHGPAGQPAAKRAAGRQRPLARPSLQARLLAWLPWQSRWPSRVDAVGLRMASHAC